METDLNGSCLKEPDVRCIFHASECVRLFCTDCQDAICVQCLLSSHQKHTVQSITDAHSSILEKVGHWHSEKESTLKAISKMKEGIVEKLQNLDELESESLSLLMECEQTWKKRLADKIENQSEIIKDHYSKTRKDLQSLNSEVLFCENGIENFCRKPEPAEVVRLYCNLKGCITGDALSQISIKSLNLELNENIDVNVRSSKVATEDQCLQNDQSLNISIIKDGDLWYKKVAIKNAKQNPVTKIVPTSDINAWLIANRKLYNLNIDEMKVHLVKNDVDDIALLENGNLFILNRNITFIYQMTKSGELFSFTCTDPYTPFCMDFVCKSKTLMIWMCQNDTRHMTLFGLDGIKKKSFTLPASQISCSYLSAQTCSNFSIIYEVEQTTGLRNYVYSYNIEPTSYKSFSGTFGCNPYLQFVCKGMCYDDKGSILVSDFQFNSVYKLDRKLQFEKIVLDRNVGLESPTALAFRDGFLWVVDAEHITIFKYKDVL